MELWDLYVLVMVALFTVLGALSHGILELFWYCLAGGMLLGYALSLNGR